MYALHYQQIIARPRDRVFAFFERPENLARITPPSLGFVIRTPSPIVMARGLEIDYTIRILGIPIPWRSRIARYEPPHAFVDEQLRGPYAFWRHTHRFLEVAQGTCVIDEVEYAIPGGPLGRLAHTLYVRRELERIFEYRAKALGPIM